MEVDKYPLVMIFMGYKLCLGFFCILLNIRRRFYLSASIPVKLKAYQVTKWD